MSKKKRSKKNRKIKKVITTIITLILVLFMIGIISAGSVAVSVLKDIGLINTGSTAKEVAGVDYIDLDSYISNQKKTTIVYAYDEDNNLIEDTRLHGSENRISCALDDVSEYVVKGFICLEDKRFYEHSGVDWIRTCGSIVYDLMGKELQGGSTITQQLIKNLTGDNKRTIIRKYREIKNALSLEKHFEKEDILEAYLNTIYLDMGCYGIKTGAEYYFGKDPGDLTLMESAILVAITNAPRKYNPIINYDNNRARATECLRCMLEQGKISQADYDAALKEEIVFRGYLSAEDNETDAEQPEETAATYQSYYTDFIINNVIKDLMSKYGYTSDEAWQKVYYGGLRIYSAVDMKIQGEMEDVYYNRITFPYEEDTEENPAIQSAMTIMNYQGRVVGIVGRLGPKKGDRVQNMACDNPRQPGSSIKPLSVYAPAIELNCFYWSSYLPNYGINLDNSGRPWPSNYGGNYGSISDLRNLAEAIAPSLNTIPARIVDTLTPARCYAFLRDRFHMSTLVDADAGYAPMAIGAMSWGVTTLDMTAAYATFGNGGVYYKPWCYYKVTDEAGNVILEPDLNGEQVISTATADVMNHLLQTVVTSSNGTGRNFYVKGFTTYAKSGTTSDFNDKWMVGGTPYYICAAWCGFEDNREITSYYGQNPSGKVYKEVMDRIHAGLEPKDFEFSGDAVRRTFCTKTGLLASSACTSCSSGWYKIDYMPRTCTACANGTAGGSDSGTSGYRVDDNGQPYISVFG